MFQIFLELLEFDGNILAFNDDIASDNESPVVCQSSQNSDNLVIEVSSFDGSGIYDMDIVQVEDVLSVNTLFTKDISTDDIFFAQIDLNEGQVYEFFCNH